ncbi:MAG TPA: putative zinc-binding protein [bacterium]|nr:putative zinc-binding protein [bacterium]
MSGKCECEAKRVVVLPCSGGSNVGQLSNAAAVKMTQAGVASMFCLAGIGGHVSGMIASCKGADAIIAIDGCSVACAKKTLEHAEIPIAKYIVVTELGVEKNKNFDLNESDIAKIIDASSMRA